MYMHQLRSRYRTEMLAVASILDLVRTDNASELQSNIMETLAHAADQLGWLACAANHAGDKDPGAACFATVKSVGGQLPRVTCQGVFLAALLRKTDPLQAFANIKASCYDVATQVTCTQVNVGTPDPNTLPPANACNFPELADTASSSAIAAIVTTLAKQIGEPNGKLEAIAADQSETFEALVKAAKYLSSNNLMAMNVAVERYAVDKLLERVSDIVQRQLGDGAATCAENVHSTSIFSGIGAACAVITLVQAAYFPIADYLWNGGGVSGQNANQVAVSAYQNLLQSKFLAGSPLMLNIGLGANVIWGDESVWGSGAYRALTIVDKFGLELYRWRGPETTFEIGPFVGGFLDALVRSIDGADHKFWLAGLAGGFPRVYGYNFGIELHAAAALPFSFDSANEVGFAAGGVIVIPWDFWKEN